MASAEARYQNEQTGLPVVFANKERRVYWSEVFENNPRILREPNGGQKVCVIENHPGNRPYVRGITEDRFVFNEKFKAEPGEIWLSPEEKERGIDGAVIIEPHVKDLPFSQNKKWPWERWVELTKIDVPWVQLGNRETLPNVRRVNTPRFRDALPYIAKASLVVTTDGALHHAAAALGVPAVVLWGAHVTPDILGYDTHTNIWHGAGPYGARGQCAESIAEMERITVDEVREAIERSTRHIPA